MAANPRMVITDTTFTWDGATQRLQKGQIVDVPAGSALETAIGTSNLVALDSEFTGGDPGDTEPEDQEGGA